MKNPLKTQLVQMKNRRWKWRFVRSGKVLNDDYGRPSKALRALVSLLKAIKFQKHTWPPEVVHYKPKKR